MGEIEIKLIKFLLSGSAYSDTAIMKNLGIGEEELEFAYSNLEKNGYLETYEAYKKRISQEKCGGGCYEGGECSSCNSCCGDEEVDYSKIRVITQKAIDRF